MTFDDREALPDAQGWRPSAREIGWFTLIVLVLVFALINFEDATIHFIFFHFTIPVFFVIAFPALIAFAAGMLFQRARQRRR